MGMMMNMEHIINVINVKRVENFSTKFFLNADFTNGYMRTQKLSNIRDNKILYKIV